MPSPPVRAMASARNSLSKNELLPVYERRSQHDGDISGSVTSFASTIGNNASAAVLAYCLSSISMTLVNKYVVSGASWNLSFVYLAMQVCFVSFSIRHLLHKMNPNLTSPSLAPWRYWPARRQDSFRTSPYLT
jgi:hypothetical protein